MKRGLGLWPLVAAIFVAACSGSRLPQTLPVEGVVLLDGQPVAEAAVMFVPKSGGSPAMGATDAAGRFRLMTFRPDDGAVPGEHRVTVQKTKIEGGAVDATGLEAGPSAGPPKIEYLVPEKYSQVDKSGLTVNVERGLPEVKLELSSKP